MQLLIGFVVGCLVSTAWAVSPMDQVFDSVQSPWLQLSDAHSVEDASSRSWMGWLFRNEYLKYTPVGEFQTSCRFELKEPTDFTGFQTQLLEYQKQCGPSFQNGLNNNYLGFYWSLMARLDLEKHPYARHVMLELPGKIRLKGFLALHDNQPRPLIILRMGLFANTEDFLPERTLFMQLFEQGPFNLLMLESMSGRAFLQRNPYRSFAGMDESVQVLQILRQLREKQEPLAKLVTDVHLAGVSMGGQGQLFAHSLQEQQSKEPWAQSTLLLCPLMNLRETLDWHFREASSKQKMSSWAHERLSFLASKKGTADTFLDDLLDQVISQYKGPLSNEAWIQWPQKLKSIATDFWQANEFRPEFTQAHNPLLIFASRTDSIVPFDLNSGIYEKNPQALKSVNGGVVVMDQSDHCTLSGPYDWNRMTSVYQAYFQNFSHRLNLQTEKVFLGIPNEHLEYLQKYGLHPQIRVELHPGDHKVRLFMTLLPNENPSWTERWSSPVAEYTLALFNFDFLREGPIRSQSEVDLYTRWINQNLRFELAGDRILASWKRIAPKRTEMAFSVSK